MSIKTMEIVEKLKGLSLLETSELVKQIEITFNIDASPIVVSNTSTSKEDLIDDSLPVQTEFDVVLEVVPSDKKIAILKVIRTLTGLALKEAKDFVDSAPKTVREAVNLEVGEDIKQQLEAVGATVSLK